MKKQNKRCILYDRSHVTDHLRPEEKEKDGICQMKRICSILLFTVMLFSVSFGTLPVSAAGGDSPSEAFYTRVSAQGLRELLVH